MTLYIDGKLCEHGFSVGRSMYGFSDVFIYGVTFSGRIAKVSCHNIPSHIVERGGTCFTGGHMYNVKRHA